MSGDIFEDNLVSVVLPTYNRAYLIDRAIRSVLNQTYKDFELIVIDDGSTDNTEKVVKEFREKDKRIKYIQHEKNKGAAVARNTGIKAAKGEYIAFQDSDDEWVPEKLEKQMKAFDKATPNVGVVYTDMQRRNKDGGIKYWHSPTVIYGNLINQKTLDYQVMNIGIQSALIKKECFNRIGLFDENFPGYEDLELFIRLSKDCFFYHIKDPLVKYYATEGLSSNANANLIARELLLEKYFSDIKKNKKFLGQQYFIIGILSCFNGKFVQGRNYLIKAAKTYPLNIKFLLVAFVSFFGQDVYKEVVEGYRKIKKIIGKM
jgi:glycosyltransferase involved in cell wall biosynthesis